MRKTLVAMTLLLATTLALGACTGPKQQINAAAIDGMLQPVCERHDKYVNADPTLSPTQREMFLRSSAELRAIQNAAMQRPTPAPGQPTRVH